MLENLEYKALDDSPVRVSIRNRCKNIVRAGIPALLDAYKTSYDEFEEEVKKYNLQKEEITLREYKLRKWCDCKKRAEQIGEKFGI